MAATFLLPSVHTIVNGLIQLVTQQITNQTTKEIIQQITQQTTQQITEQATQQINLAGDFEKDLRKLQRRLQNIQALLCDAGKGHIDSEVLKMWLKSLQSVACDAENMLGELAYESLRRKLEVGKRKRDQVICQTTSLFNGPSAILFQQDKPSVCIIYGTSGDDGRTAVVAEREIIPLKKKNFGRQYARFLEFTTSFSGCLLRWMPIGVEFCKVHVVTSINVLNIELKPTSLLSNASCDLQVKVTEIVVCLVSGLNICNSYSSLELRTVILMLLLMSLKKKNIALGLN
ncbi:hypothetical protein Vadar_006977 [Vaccinium darrowii]|uniref:Uncharacterized protein n=1 Tax=Vaccinium darrowii TaxID=229202 RepID=A0ACB7XQ48_9ERIC|nr:hypothetical protein Vadar_006977 [Vaccinium darrowii]